MKRSALLQSPAPAQPANPATEAEASDAVSLHLDAQTRGKFVLFAVPPDEQVAEGPLMRGLIETAQGKINVAGWKRVARDSGSEYLSLKVGNLRPRDAGEANAPAEWLLGPYYGRLFKQVSATRSGKRTRYFGFIEDAQKVGEDAATHKGVYQTRWQLQIRARPALSQDGRMPYIDGSAMPAGAKGDAGEAGTLPF